MVYNSSSLISNAIADIAVGTYTKLPQTTHNIGTSIKPFLSKNPY